MFTGPTFEPGQGYTAAPFSQKVKDLEQTELGMEFVLTSVLLTF